MHLLLAESNKQRQKKILDFFTDHQSIPVTHFADADSLWQALPQVSGGVIMLSDRLSPTSDSDPEIMGVALTKKIHDTYEDRFDVLLYTDHKKTSSKDVLQAGGHRFWAKPLEVDGLNLMVERIFEHRILKKLDALSVKLIHERELNSILKIILQGIHEIGFDRVRLYILTEDKAHLMGIEHVGMTDAFLGFQIPIAGDFYLEGLSAQSHPEIRHRQKGQSVLYDDELDHADVDEWIYLPIIWQENVVGLIVADNKQSKKRIRKKAELRPLSLFVTHAAAAIVNGNLIQQEEMAQAEKAWSLKQARQRATQLETLRRVSLRLSNSFANTEALFNDILQEAVQLLQAQNGGIYKYDAEQKQLKVIADYKHSENVGLCLQIGEGMAGHIVQTNADYLIIEDYAQWEGRAKIYERQRPFGAIIAVPLRAQGEIIGVLYVDDAVGRTFGKEEVDLLQLFADQTALAITNVDLLDSNRAKAKRLEDLAAVTSQLLDNLEKMDRDEQLQFIAQSACTILQAEAAGISLVTTLPGTGQETLQFVAGVGLSQEMLPFGTQQPIHNEPNKGLTGYIAYQRQLFRAHGKTLTEHPAIRGGRAAVQSGQCHSVLAMPLLHTEENGEEKLVGLLRLTNKLDELGQSSAQIHFTEEDEFIIQLFANVVQIVLRLSEQINRFEQLVENAPNGIIINGENRNIQLFNRKAAEILNQDQVEAIGQDVLSIYKSEIEARTIGQEARLNGGTIRKEKVTLITPEKKPRPVQVTLSVVQDSNGRYTEYIGYFEDLRVTQKATNKLALMSLANNILSQADTLQQGLQSLAQMITERWDVSFCRFFLFNSHNVTLNTQAVYPLEHPVTGSYWKNSWVEDIPIDQWQGLPQLLYNRQSRVLSLDNSLSQDILYRWSHILGLSDPIQSLMVVPIRWHKTVVGLMDLGQLDNSNPFTKEQENLAVAMAEQTAVLIDRLRLSEQAQQMAENLRLSYEASNTLISDDQPFEILRKIILRIEEFAQANGVRLLLINRVTETVETSFAIGIAKKLPDKIRQNGLSLKILRTGEPETVTQNQRQKVNMNPDYKKANIAASIGLPVSIDNEIFGVIWVYFEQNRTFPHNYIEALQFFVNQAAIAYDHARRMALTEQLRQAMLALTSVSTTEALLQETLLQAKKILKGDLAVIWLYDAPRNQFILNQSVSSGLTAEQWAQFKDAQPTKDGRVRQTMQRGWLGVEDIEHIPANFPVGQATVKRLKALNVKSFQAITLSAGPEMLGVLYVNAHHPQSFSEEDKTTAQTFGNQVGLALKNRMLVDKMQKATSVAQTVASISVQSNLNDLLPVVAEEMKMILACDFVCLYVFDVFKHQFQQPSIRVGTIQAPDFEEEDEEGFVRQIMDMPGAIYTADNTATDPLFQNNPFTQIEQIKSCLAVSLQVRKTQNVGIIFINYRLPHTFTKDEIDVVRLFADQAAVAIHNALLLEHDQKQAAELLGISEITQSHVMQGEGSTLEKLLQSTAKQAVQITGAIGDAARTSHIGLVKEQKIKFLATYPPEKLADLQQQVPYLDLLDTTQPIGITGEAVSTKAVRRVNDVTNNDYYYQYDPQTQSEIAVPVLSRQDDTVLAVINVEHNKPSAFDKQDEEALTRLAELVAIALENTQSYVHQLKTATSLQALYELGKTITQSKDLEEILASVARQAWLLVQYGNRQVIYSSVWLTSGQTLNMHATYPTEIMQERSQLKLPIEGRGIVVRAWRDKKIELVSSVTDDPDYFPYHEEAQSELAVPMIFEGKVIGLINVEHSEVDAINQEDVQALEALASQATIAIQNARLHKLVTAVADVANHSISTLDQGTQLNQVVDLISTSLDYYHVAIYLYDENQQQLTMYAASSTEGKKLVAKNQSWGIASQSLVGQVAKTLQRRVVTDVRQDEHYAESLPQTLGEMVFPLMVQETLIGVLDIQHDEILTVTEEHEGVAALQTMADILAHAIQNAHFYKDITSRYEEVQILEETTAQLSASQDSKEILDTAMDAALALTHTDSAVVLFWEEEEEDFYPTYEKVAIHQPMQAYDTSARRKGGYTRQIIDKGESVVIFDTSKDPNVNEVTRQKGRVSLIGVPIKREGKGIAALFVHSHQQQHFSDHQRSLLETLAAYTSTALERAKSYEDLKQAKGVIGTRTALAWMGLASSTWRHSIVGDAVNIKNAVQFLRSYVQFQDMNQELSTELQETLSDIEYLAHNIVEAPITPLLSSHKEEVTKIFVNRFLRERIKQLEKNSKYATTEFKLQEKVTDSATILASSQWLRYAFDMVIDNSIDAMSNSNSRIITLTTYKRRHTLCIDVSDTGTGIPKEEQDTLFEIKLDAPKKEGHLGRGLAMAQTIMQAYDGDIKLKNSNSDGTTMLLTLPLYR